MRLSLTSNGRALVVLAVVAYVAGWAVGYVGLMMLSAGCLVASALGCLVVLPSRRVDAERRVEPDQVCVGEPAFAVVTVTSRTPAGLPRLTIEDRVGDEVVVHELSAGEEGSVRYALPTHRRGIFTVGPTRLRRTDPLGLWQRTRTLPAADVLQVLPRWHQVAPVPAGARRDLDAQHDETTAEGSIAFHSLLEYQAGDDLRSIHWKTTARVGTLMVRQSADTSQPRMSIWLDARAGIHTEESFERAVEVAASLAMAAVGERYPVEICSTDGSRTGSLGAARPARDFLEFLAGIAVHDGGSLAAVIDAADRARPESVVVVTTAGIERADLVALARVAEQVPSLSIVNVRPDQGPFAWSNPATLVISAPTSAAFARLWNVAGR